MTASKDSNEEEASNWPKLSNTTDQETLELYIDLFRLRKEDPGKDDNICPSVTKKPDNNDNNEGSDKSCNDLLEAVKHEAQVLDKAEKKLNKMEKNLDEEEEFVSLFTTVQPQSKPQARQTDAHIQGSIKASDDDTGDSESFAILASDFSSIVTSTSKKRKRDYTNNPIAKLWIDGQIVEVKRSTLCAQKDSLLAENFNNDIWVKKHTVMTKDGTEVVLVGYSSVMLSIINQLRLKSMMVEADQLPKIVGVNKLESVENIVLKLFPGIEGFVLGKEKDFDSEVIASGAEFDFSDHLMTWLEEVDRRSEPKLLEIINC